MIDPVKAGIPVVVRMIPTGGCETGSGGSGNQIVWRVPTGPPAERLQVRG